MGGEGGRGEGGGDLRWRWWESKGMLRERLVEGGEGTERVGWGGDLLTNGVGVEGGAGGSESL